MAVSQNFRKFRHFKLCDVKGEAGRLHVKFINADLLDNIFFAY